MSRKKTALYSEETTEDEDGENMYLLQNLMDLLKKAKNRRKAREHDYYNEDYALDKDMHESQQRFAREQKYLQDEQKHIQRVHKELCDINQKLQEENRRLKDWEHSLEKRTAHLKRKEKELSSFADDFQEVVCKKLKQQELMLQEEFEARLKEHSNENKKLRSSFKIMKNTNETLKKRTEETDFKIAKYEEKNTSLQNRISNLQRKIEILNNQNKEQMTSSYTKNKVTFSGDNKSQTKEDTIVPIFHEVFGTTLHWISESYLKPQILNLIKSNQSEHDVTVEITNEKCLKVLISIPNLLPVISQSPENVQLDYIQFIYWSIYHGGLSQSSQKYSHSATYRRIGEELYQPQTKTKSTSFFKSQQVQLRVLSSLILLYTVTQADIVGQVFQSLSSDLRLEQGKSYFIQYKGAFVLLPLFKLTNKVNLLNTMDILMVLSTDSPYLKPFLENISTWEWIQSLLTVMKSYVDDVKMIEKLSLLFQRLSKIKTNKSIFEALQVKNVITELTRLTDPHSEFLQLNLRSILYNLDSLRVMN